MSSHQIRVADEWITVSGRELANGWLEWWTKDGDQGLKRPGTWRRLEMQIKRTIEITVSANDGWGWTACEEDYDYDKPVGHGRSKQDAIDDLKEALCEREDLEPHELRLVLVD